MAEKRVWILNHYAVTPDLPGETRHFDLGRELVKQEHKVTIFATSFHTTLIRKLTCSRASSGRARMQDEEESHPKPPAFCDNMN